MVNRFSYTQLWCTDSDMVNKLSYTQLSTEKYQALNYFRQRNISLSFGSERLTFVLLPGLSAAAAVIDRRYALRPGEYSLLLDLSHGRRIGRQE